MDLVFYAHFTASKVGKTGLSPTIDVDRVNRSTGAREAVVTGGSTTAGIRGYYFYRLTSADLNVYDYVATFITSDTTVDLKEVPALWSRFSEAVAVDASGRVTLAAAGLDQVAVESGINARQALALIGSATAGKAAGLDGATAVYYAMAPAGSTTVRITATTDASGNRTATTLTPPA